MNSDFRDLLKLFNAHKVRYLVVGGYAVMKYTEPRYTKDLDVWVEATPKNAKAVFAALREFGAPLGRPAGIIVPARDLAIPARRASEGHRKSLQHNGKDPRWRVGLV